MEVVGLSSGSQLLRCRPDGTFTIAQFTDMHWCNGGAEDQATAALLSAVLDAERPDLAVLTGDVLASRRSRDPEADWRAAVAPLVASGIPWAFVFGNHDDEGALDRAALMAVARSCPGCVAEPGPPDLPGVGNYVHTVQAADGAAATLYFMDSHSYAPTAIDGYAWVRREQIAWFLAQSRARRPDEGPAPPGLLFLHIPLPEYDEVWDHHECVGQKYEVVCCPRVNSGLFAALHEAGDVVAAFAGHDHTNDYAGDLHGIRLQYGRATGFQGYGREGYLRGARITRLRAGRRELESWVRLEDGSVAAQPVHAPNGRTLTA